MATYYKYIERQADSYVNWADIGKNMTDMIGEQNRIREEKKAAIDKSQKDLLEYVNANVPNGADDNARTRALELADNASKYMLMQNRLLKSGRISVKDYTIGRDNLESSTRNAYLAMQDYQAKYTEYMQRAKDGVSSLGEIANLTDAEGFGNWNQSGFYINPASGEVMIGLMDQETVNGQTVWKMSQNPNKIVSTNYVKGLLNTQWDKFDYNAEVEKWTTTMKTASMERVQTKSGIHTIGFLATTKDPTLMADVDPVTKQKIYDFRIAEEKWIKSTTQNPFTKASILFDQVGTASNNQKYFLTNDEAVANSNPAAILRIIDPNTKAVTGFKFSAEQEKLADDFMFNMARTRYERETKLTSTGQVQDQTSVEKLKYSKDIKDKQANSEEFYKQFKFLLTGTDAEVDGAMSYFTAKGFDLGKNGLGYEVATDKGVRSGELSQGNTAQAAAGFLGLFTEQLGDRVDKTWLARQTRRDFGKSGIVFNNSYNSQSYKKQVTKNPTAP